jgi:hypothetical protein
VSLGLSVIVLLISLLISAGTALQQDASHVSPQDAVSGFTQSCIDSSKARLGSATAEHVCSCAITEIQKAYTLKGFHLDNRLQV